MSEPKVLVLYLLDGNDAEAEAYDVLYFCSETCRTTYKTLVSLPPCAEGESEDYIEGTVCDKCAKELALITEHL